jgi:hypothetical protein
VTEEARQAEPTLDELLRQAAAADGSDRIGFRDSIAAFGADAVRELEPWLHDRRLGPFAVRAIQQAAAQPAVAPIALATLRTARRDCDDTTRADIDVALARLGGKSETSPRSTVGTNGPSDRRANQWSAEHLRDRSDVEARFDDAMLEIFWLAGEATGYWANYFLRKVRRHAGVWSARDLLHRSGVSPGFERLRKEGRLDLSMEALVIRPEFRELFTPNEIAIASDRLAAHGFSPGA